MTDEETMGTWDAVETEARIRAGDVTAREVTLAAIARAEAARPLGALFTETFARALDEAPRARGPLAGVPTAIKDLTRVAGVRTTWGSRAVGEHVPRRSDPTARVVAATGLVSLGKSATPEFGLTVTTEPVGFPSCHNPWDPAYSVGGSSGGAAALVSAGVVPIALASDGGGSIRLPASLAGLVGLKPTRGRLDVEGSSLLPVNVAVHGVLSRSVRDTIAFWNAVEKVARSRVPPIGEVAEAPRRPLRIAAFVDVPEDRRPVHPDVRAAVREAASLCRSLGHSVDEIPFPFQPDVLEDFLQYWSLLAWLHEHLGRVIVHPRFDATRLDPWTLGLSRWCGSAPLAVWSAIRRLRAFGAVYGRAFAGHDVLLGPTLAQPPPPLGFVSPDLPFELAKARVLDLCPFTPIQNVAGAPAIALPLGRSATGLPIGVQFAGRPHDDRLLLELARQIETARPWPRVAPASGWRGQRKGAPAPGA